MNDGSSASNRSSLPFSVVPIPRASFSASFAWSEPTMPGRTPSTRPRRSSVRARGRGEREQAAVARPARARLEHGHLALKAEDRSVDEWDPVPHGGVIDEVARGEVVRAVDDYVPALAEDALDVLRRQPLREDSHRDVGVERLDRALGRLRLALADAVRRVDDLALEVRRVHPVVVDDAERADARRAEVERGR